MGLAGVQVRKLHIRQPENVVTYGAQLLRTYRGRLKEEERGNPFHFLTIKKAVLLKIAALCNQCDWLQCG